MRMLLVSAVYNQKMIEVHHPALGFGYIASSLRKEFGDAVTFKVINSDLAENITAFQPDIVGITSVSKNYTLAKEYARIAKQVFDLPVIIGGVHITFMPQTMTTDMDIAMDGEGEATIIDLISSFMANGCFDKSELHDIEGIYFRDNGELVKTKQRKLIRPLDSIPYPARDLLTIDKSTHMLSSRGCPYHCAFCSTARLTRNQTRYASAEYMAGEIESIYKNYPLDYLTIYDDMFAIDSKRVIRIQELLAAKDLIGKFGIAVNIRSDFITDELAEVLQQMKVHVVALGTESGCQRTLDYLKSGTLAVEDNANAIRILKKHHIIPYCSFVIGSPDETLSEIMETVKFIKDNRIDYFDVSVLTPFPITPVWEYALARGLVSDDMDWTKLDFYISSNPVIVSERVSREDIAEVCRQMAIRKKNCQRRINMINAIKRPDKALMYMAKIATKRLGLR